MAAGGKGRDRELESLFAVLSRLGVDVRVEPFETDGGLVRLRDRYVLFLNRNGERARWKELCVEAIGRFDTTQLHLSPSVRRALGDEGWAEENGGKRMKP
jgi:hypothetical protein